jgi:hypothetical protein
MRILTIALSAAFLALPFSAPAQSCGAAGQHSAKAATADYSAAKKKKAKKKEKVEYMRAAPMK